MKRVVILGGGMIARAIAVDLHPEVNLEVLDSDRGQLEILGQFCQVESRVEDLSQERRLRQSIQSADLVIGALPGFLGFQSLKTVIEAGKPIVDISFFSEDPFQLDQLARQRGVTAVVDCGLAPGLCNLILGRQTATMDVHRYQCLVGGLPRERRWPFEYKAPFSVSDVLAEYTRPARMMENGQEVVKPALSQVELVDISGVGTLEAFNTDGLRTLLKTMKVPWMEEKTLRYPGHAESVGILKAAGFLARETVNLGGLELRPIDFTTHLLSRSWQLESGEPDLTILRVTIEGILNESPQNRIFQLIDTNDEASGLSSMARTTGFTCAAVARLLLSGHLNHPGILAPEEIGHDQSHCESILEDLWNRGVRVKEHGQSFDQGPALTGR